MLLIKKLFLIGVGIITIIFLMIFIIATIRVLRKEYSSKNNKMADTLGCGEHVFAILTRKNGKKEIIG